MDNQNRSRNEIPNRSRIDPRADPNRSRMDQQNRSRMVDQNRSRAFYDNRYPTPPPPPPTNYGYDKTPPPYSRNVSYYGMAAPDPNLNQIANASFYERKDASFYERKDASFNEKKDEGNASFYERKVVAPMSGREEDFNGKKGRIPRRFDEKEEKNENKMQILKDNDLFKGEKNRGIKKLFLANVITIKPMIYWKNNEVDVSFDVFAEEFGENHKKSNIPPIFQYKVERDCCSKYCLNADCRSINIILHHLDGPEFLHLKKDCSCTCLCNNRGNLRVDYLENGDSTLFGRITNPFVCCDYEFIINDENGEPKFLICADSCICGMYCACSCKFCNRSKFFIKNLSYEVIGSLEIGTNYEFCDAMVNNADFYIIKFPPGSNDKDRCMFLAAMIYIDLRYVGSKLS